MEHAQHAGTVTKCPTQSVDGWCLKLIYLMQLHCCFTSNIQSTLYYIYYTMKADCWRLSKRTACRRNTPLVQDTNWMPQPKMKSKRPFVPRPMACEQAAIWHDPTENTIPLNVWCTNLNLWPYTIGKDNSMSLPVYHTMVGETLPT